MFIKSRSFCKILKDIELKRVSGLKKIKAKKNDIFQRQHGNLEPSFPDRVVFDRNIIISKDLIGNTFSIYNGNKFFDYTVVFESIGHRFGEFAFTKQLKGSLIHQSNKIDIKKRKKFDDIKRNKLKKRNRISKSFFSRSSLYKKNKKLRKKKKL